MLKSSFYSVAFNFFGPSLLVTLSYTLLLREGQLLRPAQQSGQVKSYRMITMVQYHKILGKAKTFRKTFI